VIHGVAPKIPLRAIYRGTAPYIVSNLIRLGLLLSIPALALWLPGLLKG
jgi:C4-dicarboxylate transporter, DctM subunit